MIATKYKMSDHHSIHNLNIRLNEFHDIRQINWDSEKETFSFSVDFGKIHSVDLLDGVVLHIQFENGELRLDIDQNELDRIQKRYEEK